MSEQLSVGLLASGLAPLRLERLSHRLYRLIGVDSLFVQDHLMGSQDAVFDTPLYRDRPPRLWIAAHGPRMLELTGRFGDGWLPTHKLSPQEYAGGAPRPIARRRRPDHPLAEPALPASAA